MTTINTNTPTYWEDVARQAQAEGRTGIGGMDLGLERAGMRVITQESREAA